MRWYFNCYILRGIKTLMLFFIVRTEAFQLNIVVSLTCTAYLFGSLIVFCGKSLSFSVGLSFLIFVTKNSH